MAATLNDVMAWGRSMLVLLGCGLIVPGEARCLRTGGFKLVKPDKYGRGLPRPAGPLGEGTPATPSICSWTAGDRESMISPWRYWKAGGNCNLAFAAARLGLRCSTLGHVGEEIYGKFLLDVRQAEGIRVIGMLENANAQKHGFCSRADFSEEPAFCWIHELPAETKTAIHQSKILFCNGYAFDELSPGVIVSAIDCAIGAETAVFFDPGPRGKSLLHGNLDEQRALEHSLRLSDVLLLTSDEMLPRIMDYFPEKL